MMSSFVLEVFRASLFAMHPFCLSLKFISVSCFISPRDESNYGRVICKFDDSIGRID